MKILLVNPLVREWAEPNCFPSGLGYIATTLVNAGYNVRVYDANAIRQEDITYEGMMACEHYDIVGITGIITQYNEVKKIAECSRMVNNEAIIVCGGVIATSIPDLLLERTEIDVCVTGEGERAILKVFDEIKGESRPLKYRTGSVGLIQDLDTIPWPEYGLFPMDVYLDNPIGFYNTNKWLDGMRAQKEAHKRTMNIIGSRGCPYSCIFCYHNYMGQGHRRRGVMSIVSEIYFLSFEYDVDYFHFTDDAFACNAKEVEKFCLEVGKVPVEWSCAGRVNIMDDRLANIMKQAGCVGVCYGLESGSQTILNRLNKKVTIKQYEEAIKLSKRYFSYQDYTFLVNTPGETDATINESIKFCKDNGIVPSVVFFLTCYPGTPMWNSLVAQGKIPHTDLGWLEEYVLCLGEQGRGMEWSHLLWWSERSVEKVKGWKQKFIEETGV